MSGQAFWAAALVAGAAWLLAGPGPARLRRLSRRKGSWLPALFRRASPRLRPKRRQEAAGVELAEALDLLAVCLDAGLPLAGAVSLVTEVARGVARERLELVAGRYRVGHPGPAAWATPGGDEAWRQVSAEVARAERSGTLLAPVLREQAADLRREANDAALKRARRVSVRSMVPLMACFLPAFVLVGVVPIIAGLLTRFLG